MFAVEVKGLAKRYGAVKALAGVDLRVPAGSILGFLGPNGAGKTTTIRILVGLLRATGGQATVLGRDAWRESTEIRARVGYLSGDVRLYPGMTGTSFLSFCDRMRGGGSGAEIRRLVDRFDLDVGRRVRGYSRGMKQKLALIQCLMHRPELLILDEPTSGLDPLVQQLLCEELRSVAEQGRTVLFSSHTLSEVETLCDRVAIIRRGRVIEDTTIGELTGRGLRRVELRPREGDARSWRLPEGLTGDVDEAGVLRGSWRGPVDVLIRWMATLSLEDATVAPARLEDLFAAYYRDEGREA